MLSRIAIDLNEENKPFIKIEYKESEDVRDKLIKRFLEEFGFDSSWAKIKYIYPDKSPKEKEVWINPISSKTKDLEYTSKEILDRVKNKKDFYESLKPEKE